MRPRIRTLLVPGVLLVAGAGLLALAGGTPRRTLPAPPAEVADRVSEEAHVAAPAKPPEDLARVLERAAREPHMEFRARLDAGGGVHSLLRVTRESRSAEARAVALSLLVTLGEAESVMEVARGGAEPDLRRAAIYCLAAGGCRALDELERLATTDPDAKMAEAAVHALAAANTAEAHEALERALRTAAGAPGRRAAVYRAIEGVRPGAFPWNVPWFRTRFAPERPTITDPARPEALARLLRLVAAEPLPALRARAASALVRVGGRPAAAELAAMWLRAEPAERAAILREVRRRPDPEILDELFERAPDATADTDARRRLAAMAVEIGVPALRSSIEDWTEREPDLAIRTDLRALLDSWEPREELR